MTQSFLKLFFTESVRSIWIAKGNICDMLCFIVLHDSANDTADEICSLRAWCYNLLTTVCNWFKRFRAGNFDLKDKSSSSCHSNDKWWLYQGHAFAENLRYNVREIMDAINISRKIINNHLIKMGYVNWCEVWVPQLLTKTDFMNHAFTCDFLF